MVRASETGRLEEPGAPLGKLRLTGITPGMRKGELFALQKSDVDFDTGVIMLSRSHDRDIPKGGRVEAVPINDELVAVRDDLAYAIALIAVQPGIGAPPTNARLRGVRRLLLSRVGHWLYYPALPDRIDVLDRYLVDAISEK